MATKKATIKKVKVPKVAKFKLSKIPKTTPKIHVAKAVKLQKYHAGKVTNTASSHIAVTESRGRFKIPTAKASGSKKATKPTNY